jgi:hypothetical protein
MNAAQAPCLSAWSPVVAVAGGLVADAAPGWVTATVWAAAIVGAYAFKRLRLVVPLALALWTSGVLAASVLSVTEAVVVGAPLLTPN